MTKTISRTFNAVFLAGILSFAPFQSAHGQTGDVYDIVLEGGRVIDPETGLDAMRNVGVTGGKIAAISTNPLIGKETIDVSGLVVAPGFIDLHVHGRSNKEQAYQVHDGVTTALELEWGIEFLKEWYAARASKALINYGASVCWPFERFKAMERYQDGVNELRQSTLKGASNLEALFNVIGPSYTENLTPEEMSRMLANIQNTLKDGGIGIGVPIGYLPQTDPGEMFRVYQMAAELNALVYSHVRGPNMQSIQEVLANAMLTGAPLHIVHINSMSLGQIQLALDMVHTATEKGFDISAELYPYTAGSTLIQTAVFDPGWQEKLGMDYGDLQWVATGERLTKETFDAYRETGGGVILHMMKPEWIKAGLANKSTIVASDGMPYAKLAHPRTAGTFSRVLGKYVREEQVLGLSEALAKMTYLPAKRLEGVAPMMGQKGRVQLGKDADITVFDPNTVRDRATFEAGLEFSEGIRFVLVNGHLVLKNGAIVTNTFPGQPIFGTFKKRP